MGRHCERIPRMTAAERQRFWSLVQKSHGCWLWTGDYNCSLSIFALDDGVKVAGHRVAYILTGGDPTHQVAVCAKDPRCVNPAHVRPTPGWIQPC